MGVRVTALIVITAGLYSLLVLNMYDVQLRQGSYYRAKAASIHHAGGLLAPRRGAITLTDKDGNRIPAALTKDYPLIYAVPEEFLKAEQEGKVSVEEVTNVLSVALGKSADELADVLRKEGDPFEPLVKKAPEEMVALVKERAFPGIHIDDRPSRFYPLGRVASQTIGFVSTTEDVWEGQYGLEYLHDETLSGITGESSGDELKMPEHGEDLALTIDYNIQTHAESVLEELVTTYGAQGGTVIVEDPRTGAILALANYPSFDPNDYGSASLDSFMNPAVQRIYEPGSIVKVITMAAALDAGVVRPDTTYVDTGALTLNGKTIHNWDMSANGRITMTNVIEKSLNTGAAFAERALGDEAFYDYLIRFGWKEKTDIDLPGEIIGSLSPLENDPREINFATASFGQGISVTPLRLISSIAAIANGGVMMRPYVSAAEEPKVVRRVISEKAAKETVTMMVSAVEKNVVGHIEGYSVAGKTGTAQVPDFKRGGYSLDVINTYVGFAPAYDPRFVILVKLEKPAGAPLAGMTVVPAFRQIAQSLLNYYAIPPDLAKNGQ